MKLHYCEKEDEYVICKILLHGFIKSVNDYKGSFNIMNILFFIAAHIVVHEEHYVFYKRKSIRYFDEKDNCPCEGTNNGSKNCARKVTPNIKSRQDFLIVLLPCFKKCSSNSVLATVFILPPPLNVEPFLFRH